MKTLKEPRTPEEKKQLTEAKKAYKLQKTQKPEEHRKSLIEIIDAFAKSKAPSWGGMKFNGVSLN